MISHRPTVAAIITFYCDDRFFSEALRSVLAQTVPPDEIVVVDDASPPGTAISLEQLDSRVRVVRLPTNQGAGAARQAGADATSADLLGYLDADDIWLPTRIARQLEIFASDPDAAAVHCAMTMVRRDGTESTFLDKPQVLDLPTELRKNQALPSAMMIRREALQAVGGWSRDRRLMEDWDLNIRLVASGARVVFLAEALVRFRRTGQGNLSSRGFKHLGILLRTVAHHQRIYRRTLGLRATIGVAGNLIRHEGDRRGGLSGRILRMLALALTIPMPRMTRITPPVGRSPQTPAV